MAIMINGGGGVGDFSPAGPAPGPGDPSWGGYVPPDPNTSTPADIKPLVDTFEQVASERPGPDGEGGTVPGDPVLGAHATFTASDQPSPRTLTGSVQERVGQLACYQFHYFDYVCGGTTILFAFPGYFVGTNKGSNFPCQDSENVGNVVPTMLPGDGSDSCYTIFSGPGGPSCVQKCSDPSAPSGDNTPVGPGPVLLGQVRKDGPQINTIKPKALQGSPGSLDIEIGTEDSPTFIGTAVTVGGGIGVNQTPTHTIVVKKTPGEPDQPIAAIPRNGTLDNGPGSPDTSCCPSSTSSGITSIKSRPTDGTEPWTYYPTNTTPYLTTGITCVPCDVTLQPRVVTGPSPSPTPAVNDPRPQPTPQTNDKSKQQNQKPLQPPPPGIKGNIKQVIIIQDDSSQHFVQVVGTNG